MVGVVVYMRFGKTNATQQTDAHSLEYDIHANMIPTRDTQYDIHANMTRT